MEIQAGPLDWLSTDEEHLAKFLETDTGKRFLPKLLETAPALLSRGHVNSILIRSGELRGYQQLVQNLLALAHPAPVERQAVPEYAPLEDDKHWNDGQKLTKE